MLARKLFPGGIEVGQSDGELDEDERQRVRQQLEEYCGQDTEGMIWILDALRSILAW